MPERQSSVTESTDLNSLKNALPETPLVETTTKIIEQAAETNDSNTSADVLTRSSDHSYFYVRLEKEKLEFDKFLQKMSEFYTEHHKDSAVAVETVEANKLYAVLDAAFNWCRVLVKVFLSNDYLRY